MNMVCAELELQKAYFIVFCVFGQFLRFLHFSDYGFNEKSANFA